MGKGRLEAFSDGVIAILITIMVLELEVPHGTNWAAVRPLVPSLLSYLLSFIFIAIYWNNHHHMLHATDKVDGRILWANMHLLFWLSLVPFATAWIGENHIAALPTAAYGAVLLLCGLAYTILQRTIIARQDAGSRLAAAVGNDKKGMISLLCYALAIPLAFVRDTRLRARVDRRRTLRRGRAHVAHSRPADRAQDRAGIARAGAHGRPARATAPTRDRARASAGGGDWRVDPGPTVRVGSRCR
ncbi:MAG: TMEM175 family protein [Gemmatimonadaceae bacterium]